MRLIGKNLLAVLMLQAAVSGNYLYADVYRQNINEGWKFKQARLDNWYDATFGNEVSLNAKLHLLTGNYDDTKAVPQIKDIVVTPDFEYELPAYSFSLIEL